MTCNDTVIVVFVCLSDVGLSKGQWFEAGQRDTVRAVQDAANKVTPFGRLSLIDGTWCMLPGWVARSTKTRIEYRGPTVSYKERSHKSNDVVAASESFSSAIGCPQTDKTLKLSVWSVLKVLGRPKPAVPDSGPPTGAPKSIVTWRTLRRSQLL